MTATKKPDLGRRLEEFWCDTNGGGCGCYFMTYLRENMTGAYTIVCANERSRMDTVVSWGAGKNDFKKAKILTWNGHSHAEVVGDAEKAFTEAVAKGLTLYADPLEKETKSEADWKTIDTFSHDLLRFHISVPCAHNHFRKIQGGLITTDRDYKAQEQKEKVKGVGPVRMTPWHDDPEFRRSLMRKV